MLEWRNSVGNRRSYCGSGGPTDELYHPRCAAVRRSGRAGTPALACSLYNYDVCAAGPITE